MKPETIAYLKSKLREKAYGHVLTAGESRWHPAVLIPKRVIREILKDAKASEVQR